MAARRSEENLYRGDFGESLLEAVAAAGEILHGRPSSLDLEKADVEFTLLGLVASTYNPMVKVQVKTTINARWNQAGDLVYDLDVTTYDVLRRTDHAVRRVLVVVALPAAGALATVVEQGILLLGQARWVCLEGWDATDNTTSIAVILPGGNTVDAQGMRTMLSTYGVRTSSPVPDVDEWEEDT